jgi:hypothetical protein
VYFGAAVPHFINGATRRQRRQRLDDQLETKQVAEADDVVAIREEKRKRLLRKELLVALWNQLSPDERLKYLSVAAANARSDFDRRRLSRPQAVDDPPREALEEMSVGIGR